MELAYMLSIITLKQADFEHNKMGREMLFGSRNQVSNMKWFGFESNLPQKCGMERCLEGLGKGALLMFERIGLAAMRAFYTLADAADRIRRGSDGLDKLLKLLSGFSIAAALLPAVDKNFYMELGGRFRTIDRMFSGVSVFGRYNELLRLDKSGQRAILRKSSFKQASVVFLTIAKSFEFVNLLKTLGFYTAEGLKQFDTDWLGGIAMQMGQLPLVHSFVEAGINGSKSRFLILASTYAIVNNAVLMIDGKATDYEMKRAVIGTLQDGGKIYLCFAVFSVTWPWALIAIFTGLLGLTKILLDSYEASRIKGEPTGYPQWMLKA